MGSDSSGDKMDEGEEEGEEATENGKDLIKEKKREID